ncbi:MAG: LacI family DNA-binding transcriptional regulator [Clostridia bacterium]|nr:LacI family DNA-binding transcriptional regulator [Clostridia bacterium]
MNIKDIARLAGTSPSTVSRILNDDPRVSPATRENVLRIIEETQYKPNALGRNLRTHSSKKLLMMLPTMQNPFYHDIFLGFEEVARQQGYSVLVAVTNRNAEMERLYFDLLFTRQVDGTACFLPTLPFQEISQIAEDYPFVACCWRGFSQLNINYVCIDNEQATREAMQYLISLGHRRIAALNGNFTGRMYEVERGNGYRHALEEAGIPYDPELDIICEYSHKAGYAATARLMALKKRPTAIMGLSDDRAAGVVKYLTERGIRPGVDVDVVGFDNVPISEAVTPSLTTVSQPRLAIGREAANILLTRIEDPAAPIKGVILSHKLIIRESTRKPGAPVGERSAT